MVLFIVYNREEGWERVRFHFLQGFASPGSMPERRDGSLWKYLHLQDEALFPPAVGLSVALAPVRNIRINFKLSH